MKEELLQSQLWHHLLTITVQMSMKTRLRIPRTPGKFLQLSVVQLNGFFLMTFWEMRGPINKVPPKVDLRCRDKEKETEERHISFTLTPVEQQRFSFCL